MKYVSYYQENSNITRDDYNRILQVMEDEPEEQIQVMTIRKIEFTNIAGYSKSDDEEETRYSICMADNDENSIYLEKKVIAKQVIFKNSCKLSKEECLQIIEGDIYWMQNNEHALINDLYWQMTINKRKPEGIREYAREIYQYGKNSQVVFDKRIKKEISQEADFFSKEGLYIDCLPQNQIRCSYRRNRTIPRMIANMMQSQEQVGEFAFA